MAKPESKVCYCNNKPIECPICFTLNDKLIVDKQQEQEARRELQQNLNIRAKEKELLQKIEAQAIQIHDLHAHLSLRQKDCTTYLEEIADLKRENNKVTNDLSSLKVEYDILQSKVANYSCSARILNSVEVKQTGKGPKSYNYVDRPYDFTATPDLGSEYDSVALGPMPPPPVPLEQDQGDEERPILGKIPETPKTKDDKIVEKQPELKSVLGPMPPPPVPMDDGQGDTVKLNINSGKGKLKETVGRVEKSNVKPVFENKEMDTSASTSGPNLPKNYVTIWDLRKKLEKPGCTSLNDMKRIIEEDKAKGLETGITVTIGKPGPKMGGLGCTKRKTEKLVWKQTGLPVKPNEGLLAYE